MANAPPQFTPAQILEAGQRAEADGRFEHAKQFYRHLVDHHRQTSEFALARDGLGRLDGFGRRQEDPRDGQYANAFERAPRSDAMDARPTRPFDANGQPAEHHLAGGHPQADAEARRRVQLAPSGYDPGEAVFDDEIEEPRAGYRFGRILAAMLTVVGVVMMVGGCALAGVMFTSPAILTDRLGDAPVLPAILVFAAPCLVVAGFFICLGSQLARALFDTADATQRAAALQAARSAARTTHARQF